MFVVLQWCHPSIMASRAHSRSDSVTTSSMFGSAMCHLLIGICSGHLSPSSGDIQIGIGGQCHECEQVTDFGITGVGIGTMQLYARFLYTTRRPDLSSSTSSHLQVRQVIWSP